MSIPVKDFLSWSTGMDLLTCVRLVELEFDCRSLPPIHRHSAMNARRKLSGGKKPLERADGEGFEPPVQFPTRRFSKPVP